MNNYASNEKNSYPHASADNDHTVLVPAAGAVPPASGSAPSLTGESQAIDYQALRDRMVYTAEIQSAQGVYIGENPLLDSAMPLFTEWAELRTMPKARGEQLEALGHQLREGIKNYEYHAMSSGCQREEVLVGRYILCSSLDEAVVTTPWGTQSNWAKDSLLSHFHNETSGGEKVFSLIETLTSHPAKYLDLLELAYVCLSLGFEGKFRKIDRGHLEVETLRDNLYRQIRLLRGDIVQEFSPNWRSQIQRKNKMTRLAPLKTIALITAVSLGVMFTGFTYVLRQQSQQVAQLYQTPINTLPSDKTMQTPMKPTAYQASAPRKENQGVAE